MSSRDGEGVEEVLRSIGSMSRESGLTVSALRFYDGAGVLSPAFVDPGSGYRYYAPDQLVVARTVAVLRRAGMPLAGIRDVLAHRHDADAVDALLAAHLRRLEHGLADAKRALSTIGSLIAPEENPVPTTVTLDAAELAAALRAVRFAASTNAEFPVLGSVLFDVDAAASTLTVVATDRYRLALASVPTSTVDGPAAAAAVPLPLVDGIAALLGGAAAAQITLGPANISVDVGGAQVGGEPLPDAFPDYRRLVQPRDGTPVPVDATALRSAVAAGPQRTSVREQDGQEFAVIVLGLDGGAVTVVEEGVAVNREFLLEAVDAGGGGQLLLELDGPTAPLAIRTERSVSLLMPVRL